MKSTATACSATSSCRARGETLYCPRIFRTSHRAGTAPRSFPRLRDCRAWEHRWTPQPTSPPALHLTERVSVAIEADRASLGCLRTLREHFEFRGTLRVEPNSSIESYLCERNIRMGACRRCFREDLSTWISQKHSDRRTRSLSASGAERLSGKFRKAVGRKRSSPNHRQKTCSVVRQIL